MIYNRIPITFGQLRVITGPTISYQYDTVQLLVFSDIDLPDYYTVDFCNTGDSETTTITGTPDGVRIPNELLLTGRDIKAYVVLTGTDEGAVETRYEITLPVRNRPMRQGVEPTPEERLEIETLVNALNDGVSRAETAADEAEQAAELLANPSAEATTLEPGSEATAEYANGVFSFGIPKGQKGDKLTYADLTEEDKDELVQGPILEAQTEAVNAVNAAGTRNVTSVDTAGTTNVNSVNSAGTTQVGNVNQAGATQVQAIEDKGEEVIESIPADYTALDAKVTSLNQAINALDGVVNDTTTGLDTKAPAIINNASGAIASFADGADGMPVKKLVVNVEPVQDLHGYDNPWPAGGWKNLLENIGVSGTSKGITAVFNDDGTVTLSGTNDGSGYSRFTLNDHFQAENGVEYTMSGAISSAIAIHNVSAGVSDTGNSINFTGTGSPQNIELRVLVNTAISGSVVIKPMIRLATEADSTFAPYSNICPISGWTGAHGGISGNNIFDEEHCAVYARYLDANSWRPSADSASYLFRCKPSTTYVISAGNTDTTLFRAGYFEGEIDPASSSIIPGKGIVRYTSVTSPIVITTSISATYIAIQLSKAVIDNRAGLVQVSFGTTPIAYEPYHGSKLSVTFPSAAGTVYGGTITVYPDRTGALVVDRAIVDLGTLAWNYAPRSAFNLRSTNYIGAASPATTTTVPNAVSSVYPVFSYVGVSDMDKSLTIVFATSGQAGRVWVHDESFSNADTFKSAMSGVQLVYELATPVTYTLTESEISGILETLYGTNNIWADCGDTSVTYAADTKLYIEHLTQPTEDDMTADHAISAGTFFMIGNTLYLATSQIAAGATITPGTNATQLSLADALNQLNT